MFGRELYMEAGMNKAIVNLIKKILASVLVIAVVCLFALLFSVWYNTFDVIGLEFYDDSVVEDIFFNGDRVYISTQSGKLYMTGGYSTSNSRKYRNSEFYKNGKLGIPSPIMIYDGENGKIKSVVPCTDSDILLVTDNGTLYDLSDFELKRIVSRVSNAVKDYKNDSYIAVLEDASLIIIDRNGAETILYDDVTQVSTYKDSLYILFKNGELRQLFNYSLPEIRVLKEPLLSNVKSFQMLDSSACLDGLKFIENDAVAIKEPLMNVLLTTGELYAKGAYNLIKYNGVFSHTPSAVNVLNEWVCIGENVLEYSLAHMGTVMLRSDSNCEYFGFDMLKYTSPYPNSVEFIHYKLPVENVLKVQASDFTVCVKTEDEFYYWAEWSHNIFSGYKRGNEVPRGEAFIIKK